MPVKLTFLGGAQNVTGSSFLLENGGMKILIDCGLFQERENLHRNWESFGFEPASLDAVLLTHAHLDHCGLLPRLVKQGFNKAIYCTSATAEIAGLSLLDAAKMQEEDAAFKKKRHEREGRRGTYPELPLFDTADVRATIPHFSPVEYGRGVKLGSGLNASFYNAGHVLGASMIKVNIISDKELESLVFSGDIGRSNDQIMERPAIFYTADYLVMECTYGGRSHESEEKASERLLSIIKDTIRSGGNVVIPSFVLERAQDLLYYIGVFLESHRIPPIPVFLDSPLAIDITAVFSRHAEYLNHNMRDILASGRSPFKFAGLNMVSDIAASKAINDLTGPAIIIAGSGMATGGRIKHHLVNNITRPESTIVFVGYQSKNTLGRQIEDGAKEVRILGQIYPVRARIEKIDGFSAHADNDELLKWLSAFKQPPRKLFVVHAELSTAQRFAALVKEKYGWNVVIPAPKEAYAL